MWTLCVSYLVREDANFVERGGCFDNDEVRTWSPEKEEQSKNSSAEEKRWENRFFRRKSISWSWTSGKMIVGAKASFWRKRKTSSNKFCVVPKGIHQKFHLKCWEVLNMLCMFLWKFILAYMSTCGWDRQKFSTCIMCIYSKQWKFSNQSPFKIMIGCWTWLNYLNILIPIKLIREILLNLIQKNACLLILQSSSQSSK